MHIIFFSHPDFLGHKSMPRFTNMLAEGMLQRGHAVEIWKPEPIWFNYSNNKFLGKWLGYLDQFIIFPRQVRNRIKKLSTDTVFVLTDHALGPWMPLIKNRPHVVHCHDFLAQFSALGLLERNKTSFTGKLYQNFIRRGYSQARNFISVSKKTKADLLQLIKIKSQFCDVVYNGLNQTFSLLGTEKSRQLLSKELFKSFNDGYILHVGGNQWYKNRLGVIEIYNTWRSLSHLNLPLLLIGEQPTVELTQKRTVSKYKQDIYFFDNVTDEQVRLAYEGACVLIFPSFAEGFGWPIAEAMASGCPVITSNEMPMTEVAGQAGFFIPIMPKKNNEIAKWAEDAALMVEYILNVSLKEHDNIVKLGMLNAKRFETKTAIDAIEKIYLRVLNDSTYLKKLY